MPRFPMPGLVSSTQIGVRSRRVPGRGRRLAVIGATAGVLLALAGCGGQVGAAAVVGSTGITSDSIEAQRGVIGTGATDTLVVSAGEIATRIGTDRSLLTNEIWHQLLTQLAVPVPLTEEQLNTYLVADQANPQLAAELAATPGTLHDRIADAATLQQLLADTVQAGTPVTSPTVTFDYLQMADLDTALAARSRYQTDPDTLAVDLAAAAADGTGGNFTASAAGNGVSLISSGLFTAEPGQMVIAAGNGTATLFRIVSRTTESTPIDQSALGQLSLSQLNALGALVLQQQADQIPAVQVNPKFGVWDADLLQVVAGPGQV